MTKLSAIEDTLMSKFNSINLTLASCKGELFYLRLVEKAFFAGRQVI